MTIPTEPVGSVPRPRYLLDALAGSRDRYRRRVDSLEAAYDRAVRETIARVRGDGVARDHGWRAGEGELRDVSAARRHEPRARRRRHPVRGWSHAPAAPPRRGPVQIHRLRGQLPRACEEVHQAAVEAGGHRALCTQPALSADGPRGLHAATSSSADLVRESAADIRSCFDGGAVSVQLDFTEGRLAVKLDPSRGLLRQFVDLNNAVLATFSDRAAPAHRRAHVPGRRSRFHAQRRRRLRGAAARPVPHRRAQLLHPAGERAGPARESSR